MCVHWFDGKFTVQKNAELASSEYGKLSVGEHEPDGQYLHLKHVDLHVAGNLGVKPSPATLTLIVSNAL